MARCRAVNSRQAVIDQNDRCGAVQRSSQCDALLLATRKSDAALTNLAKTGQPAKRRGAAGTNLCELSTRKHGEIRQQGTGMQCLLEALLIVRRPKQDVAADGVALQPCWQTKSSLGSMSMMVVGIWDTFLSNIRNAVDVSVSRWNDHMAALAIHLAQKGHEQRCLATPSRTHNETELATRKHDVDVIQCEG